MSADVIALSILQTIRIGSEILERHQRGELTEDQLSVEAKKMRDRLADAAGRWEAAKNKRSLSS